jgi:hypothetical protein
MRLVPRGTHLKCLTALVRVGLRSRSMPAAIEASVEQRPAPPDERMSSLVLGARRRCSPTSMIASVFRALRQTRFASRCGKAGRRCTRPPLMRKCVEIRRPSRCTPAGARTRPPARSRCRSTRRPPSSSRTPARRAAVRAAGARQHLHPHHEPDRATCWRSASRRSKAAWRRWRSARARRRRPFLRAQPLRGRRQHRQPPPTSMAAPGTCSPTR